MNTKAAADLTLDDMRELLDAWEPAYLRLPLEPSNEVKRGLQTITEYLRVVLGNLFMRRLITLDEMRQISAEAVDGYNVWARLSFEIGLDTGLGRLDDTDLPFYLLLCSQPYLQSLLGPLSLLRDHANVDEIQRYKPLPDLGRLLHNLAIRLASSGYVSGRCLQTGLQAESSPVVEFFRGLDITALQQDGLNLELLEPVSA
jgi:hypothetical protein